ncbi:hypothetical protein P3102_10650 [Amycolatopsis sp. QT-25]|uniref:hypothetical protein n=1 Tax=Amycolatopsis sp. QT-25 TaxID=3034022 RepID=UPI0023EDEEFC|nr:hypothetical protein [Amycolatopsis sp. QT-25]WET81630.1 hypothetical protein P3102_10650 [Amycolatopsis sp. QT-25]
MAAARYPRAAESAAFDSSQRITDALAWMTMINLWTAARWRWTIRAIPIGPTRQDSGALRPNAQGSASVGVVVEQLQLTMQITGVPGSATPGGVAAGYRPPPLQEYCVDIGRADVSGLMRGEAQSDLGVVAVRLQEKQLVLAGAQAVDQRAAMAASAVGVSRIPETRKPQKLYPIFTS